MDILNWIYMKTAGLVKTSANDAETDLVALGANVGFQKRGDSYQTYAMTLADAVASGCQANNTYKVGIYDVYPWIVSPGLVKTCTKIQDTPNTPTMWQGNLLGYKLSGSIELYEADTSDVFYIGTIETLNDSDLNIFPWSIDGSVSAWPNGPFPLPIISAFANGATIEDDNGDAVPMELLTIAYDQYAYNGADVYLVYNSNTAVSPIYADLSFEYEFLLPEGVDITFTIY